MVGARYGRFPHEILDSLPFRVISRLYLLIVREKERDRLHREACAGGEREEPDWLTDDEPAGHSEPVEAIPPGHVRIIIPGVGPRVLSKDSDEYKRFTGG